MSSSSPELARSEVKKAAAERRIVAVVLPQLPCELVAESARLADRPLGVVVVDAEGVLGELAATAPLSSTNEVAQRLGVTAGQTIVEARALVAGLRVQSLLRQRLESALQTVAEVALGFGTTVSIRLAQERGAELPNTVWVDITGVAHLFEGERQLVTELASSVRALGHQVQIAVASGPWLAQALARWGATLSVGELPIVALPLDAERAAWLTRVGVHTWGELAALPREAAAVRLGEHASLTLDLCEGRDDTPLTAYRPPRSLVEERSFEDPVDGLQPLAFVLRGLASRISARLAGRGEAAQALVVKLQHDRAIARLRGVPPQSEWRFDLSPPLYRENELYRLILSRLERVSLGAPTERVELSVPLITAAAARQLGFLVTRGVDELPVLLAELAADVGANRVGVLRVVDSHRPEAQSVLGQAVTEGRRERAVRSRRKGGSSRRARGKGGLTGDDGRDQRLRVPTRFLPRPVPLRVALRGGASLFLGSRAYVIERIAFERRLEAVEWWSRTPASRDYFRLLLRGSQGVVEALVYVDRSTKERFLQAIYD